jgi:hypothetical protein
MNSDRLTSRLPLLQFSALLLCLVLAVVAQSYLERPEMLTQGKVLFVVALILAWWTLGREAGGRGVESESVPSHPRALRRMAPFLALAVVADVIAAAYAMTESRARDGLYLWIIALAVASVAVVAYWVAPRLRSLRPLRYPPTIQRQRLAEIVVLAGIIVLALYLRLVDIGQIPAMINQDEGNDGIQAMAIADGSTKNVFMMGMGSMPRLTMAPAAIVMSLWKADLEGLRASMALVGVLGLPVLYLLARLVLSVPFSLLATFILAVAPASIHWSRYGVPNIQAAVITVAFVLFLVRAVQRVSSSDALCAGVVGGLAVYSYHSNRVLAVITGAILLHALLRDRAHWRDYVRLGLIILIVVLFVAAPQLAYYASNPQAIFGHTAAHVWLTDPGIRASTNPADALPVLAGRMADRAFWGFNTYEDLSEHYTNGRLLDPITGVLYLLGLAVCVRKLRDIRYLALVITFLAFVTLLGALILVPPDSGRMAGLLPIQCLMAGIALERIWGIANRAGRPAGVLAGLAVFALGPVLLLGMNYDYYFNVYSPSRTYTDVRSHVARFLQTRDVTPFVLRGDFSPNDAQFRFVAPDKTGYMMLYWEDFLPVRQTLQRDAAFIATASALPGLSLVQDLYPEGNLEEVYRPDGRLLFASYRVPAGQFEGTQGIAGRYTSADGQQIERRDSVIAFDWTKDRPNGISENMTAAWDGTLFVPEYGEWRLRMQGDGLATLALDGATLVEKNDSAAAAEGQATLSKGWHTLHMDLQTTGGVFALVWANADREPEPVRAEYLGSLAAVHGLRARYYAGTELEGTPVIEAIEPAFFNRASPYTQRYGTKPCAASWSGFLTTERAGAYRFAAQAYHGILELKIDGVSVITIADGVTEMQEGGIDLQPGAHAIEMSFISPRGQTDALQLWWAPPDRADFVLVPPAVLTPAPQ